MISTKNIFNKFWKNIADLILNHRIKWLTTIGLVTVFMIYEITKLELSYELPKFLPQTDASFKLYEDFKARYGEDGNVMVIAFDNKNVYDLATFNEWYDLSKKLKTLDGIKNVLSVSSLMKIKRNDSLKKFDFIPIVKNRPHIQAEVDSIKSQIQNLPFYDGFIYNGNAQLMAVTFDQAKMNSKGRISISLKVFKSSCYCFYCLYL